MLIYSHLLNLNGNKCIISFHSNKNINMSRGRRKGILEGLTQREQETMNLIYQYQPCSAIDIQKHMTGNLSNATVRTILRTLESKNQLKHTTKGQQFYYEAIVSKNIAASESFRTLINTFFSGSITDAVTNFIDKDSLNVDIKELDELARLIEATKLKKKN